MLPFDFFISFIPPNPATVSVLTFVLAVVSNDGALIFRGADELESM